MAIQDVAIVETIAAIRDVARAVVFLSVSWSCPEREARQAFRVAAALLEEANPELGVRFFMLDEDAEASQEWLSSLNIPRLGGGYALGAGSLLWLEQGKVIVSEINAGSLGTTGVVARSRALWHTPANGD